MKKLPISTDNVPPSPLLEEFLGNTKLGADRKTARTSASQVALQLGAQAPFKELIGTSTGGIKGYATKAELDLVTAGEAKILAKVFADPNPQNNGTYKKLNAAGVAGWQIVEALAERFIDLTNLNAATPNAITASAIKHVPAIAPGTVFTLPINLTTTAETVTVIVNGNPPRKIVTNSNNDPSIGSLKAGSVIMYVDDGVNFRLLTDADAAAILAAVETIRDQTAALKTDVVALVGNVSRFSYVDDAALLADTPNNDPQIVSINGFLFEKSLAAPASWAFSKPNGNGTKYVLRETVISPEIWGAVGGVVGASQQAANATAFNAFYRYLLETGRDGVLLDPLYEISSPIVVPALTNTDVRLKMTAPNGTKVKYTGASNVNGVFDARITNLAYGHIEGIVVDAQEKAHCGILLTSGTNGCSLISRHNKALNLKILDDAAITLNGFGIRVGVDNAVRGAYGEIFGCEATNLTKDVRTGGTLPMQGLALINFDKILFDCNTVYGVRHDRATKEDADGIIAFSGQDGGVYRRTVGSISNNVIRNAEGRGFKLQTNGSVETAGNRVEIIQDGGQVNDLIIGWSAFESQTGNCDFLNNTLIMDGLWTGGAGSRALLMQIPSAPLGKTVLLKSDGLDIQVGKPLSRLWEILPKPCSAEVFMECLNMKARGAGAVTSFTAADTASSFFAVITAQTGLSASDKINIRTQNLDLHTINHYVSVVGSSGLSSATDILSFESFNDQSYPLADTNRPFFTSSSTLISSSLTISGSKIGRGRVDGDLDWSKFGSGFDTYVGSGTMINSDSQTFRRVSKQGATLLTYNINALRISVNNGAAWSADIS